MGDGDSRRGGRQQLEDKRVVWRVVDPKMEWKAGVECGGKMRTGGRADLSDDGNETGCLEHGELL